MKYVVCYSGGHSSALAAVETVRRHGPENVILLNHDISPEVEHPDVKRFKNDVASHLGIPVSYANAPEWETLSPVRVALKKKGFQVKPGQALCTHHLKTLPFYKWLSANFPRHDCTIVYGFDSTEAHRVERRTEALRALGYSTEFPLMQSPRAVTDIETIGIKKPCTYAYQKHANCMGCLKAGRQHWYMVYCIRPDIFMDAMEAEATIGHSIIKGVYLKELVPTFQLMKEHDIEPQDAERPQAFWARVRQTLK